MRIHTNVNLMGVIDTAATTADADIFDLVSNDSRSHDYGFTVKLTGDAPNRPNGWDRDRDGDVRAASWDQWGIFLSVLFDRDPDMIVGSVGNPTYEGVADFDRQTGGRFAKHLAVDGGRRRPTDGVLAGMDVYTPVDLHHRHTFDYVGNLATGGAKYKCRKCTATRVGGR